MTLTGTAGLDMNLTDTDSDTGTGSVAQIVSTDDEIKSLTVSSSDIVYSITGIVGTTSFDLNLNAVDNQSGTGYSTTVVRNNSGDFTSLKMLVLYNTHASNSLLIGAPSSNSLLTWNSTSDTLSIPPGGAFAFVFSTALSIGSNGKIEIFGSSGSTTFKVFIFGA